MLDQVCPPRSISDIENSPARSRINFSAIVRWSKSSSAGKVSITGWMCPSLLERPSCRSGPSIGSPVGCAVAGDSFRRSPSCPFVLHSRNLFGFADKFAAAQDKIVIADVHHLYGRTLPFVSHQSPGGHESSSKDPRLYRPVARRLSERRQGHGDPNVGGMARRDDRAVESVNSS